MNTDRRVMNELFTDSYICPHCKNELSDLEAYLVDNKLYPQYFNRVKGFNGHNDTDDWDELHCCDKCKRESYMRNGI